MQEHTVVVFIKILHLLQESLDFSASVGKVICRLNSHSYASSRILKTTLKRRLVLNENTSVAKRGGRSLRMLLFLDGHQVQNSYVNLVCSQMWLKRLA